VTFTPTGIPELTKPLQIDISMVSKYFEPGDFVRVTEAKYKGETGTVIDVDGPKVSMILDQSQQEIKIHANFLKLKSDTDAHQASTLFGYSSVKHNLNAMDLVQYNGNKNAGLVLQVNEDFIKLINEQGKIENVKIADLGKKLPAPSRGGTLGGRDSQGNALGLDQMVKVVNGSHKGKIGPIRHGFKNYLFLWHKDFALSNGIFVENCRNVVILGAEFMKGVQGQAVATQNRLIKDPLFGKMVVVKEGKFKGHRGTVTQCDDKQAMVELTSQCKKLPFDKSLLMLIEPEELLGKPKQAGEAGRSFYGGATQYGGATVYGDAKTPMHVNTPSCYPQSAWGGGVDCKSTFSLILLQMTTMMATKVGISGKAVACISLTSSNKST